MIASNCEYCGKEKTYNYKSHVKRFCSYKCARLGSPKEPGEKIKITCTYCQKDFQLLKSTKKTRERNGNKIKYCSTECSSKDRIKAKEIECKNCNKIFVDTRGTFCSSFCSSDYRKRTGSAKKSGYWYENGYKVLYLDGDNSIKEHIKVMEDHIGRKLNKNEVVHHINEVKDDNRIENLQLMTRSEHSKYHREKEINEGKGLFGRENNGTNTD